MRRRDREVREMPDILAILDGCEVMRLGMCDGGTPYIVPMNFAYETAGGEIFLYFHCAPQGRKLDIIAQNNRVCFEADRAYKTVKADRACEWSAEYQSVMGEGVAELLPLPGQKAAALDLLMKRYGFEGKPEYGSRELDAVTVLRVSVLSISGKSRIIAE